MKNIKNLVILILLLSYFSSCQSYPPTRHLKEEDCKEEYCKAIKENSKKGWFGETLFRGRWWNYYERAFLWAECGKWECAVADLQEALKQRSKDQRDARTYGMRVMDYFPNRELGIVYYKYGKLEEAKNRLELSLSQSPSDKVLFYLESVYKSLVDRGVAEISKPKITIDGFLTRNEHDFLTRDETVILSGNVEDKTYIKSITIQEKTYFSLNSAEELTKNSPFKTSLNLSEGSHLIKVEAENIMRGMSSKLIKINVDRLPPDISIKGDVKVKDDKTVTIDGSIFDESGVAEFFINEQKIPISQSKEINFNETLKIESYNLILKARDVLGNEKTMTVPLSQSLKSYNYLPILLASNAGNDSELIQKKSSHIKVEIKNLTDGQEVYQERVYLSVEVSSDDVIKNLYLELNGNKIDIRRLRGKKISFGYMLELNEGENKVIVKAIDEAGNEGQSESIVIIRKESEKRERMALLVFPFEVDGEYTQIRNEFKDFFSFALKENGFRILTDEKSKDARYKIEGKINISFSNIEIVGKVIDTETSELITYIEIYDEAYKVEDLKSFAYGLANKILIEFPLLKGKIVEINDNIIFTNLSSPKLKVGTRLIIYREKEGTICYAKIKELLSDRTKAELQNCKPEDVKEHDMVITE